MKSLHYLHLEDSTNDIYLVQELLKKNGYDVDPVIVQSEDEFRDYLNDESIQLLLADYTIPGFDGIEALRIARALRPLLPVILVTGTLGEEFAIDCLHEGATDYVLKQNLQRLAPAVKRALSDAARQREIETARSLVEENELFLRTITDHSYDAIVSIDQAGLIQYYSRSAERMFGRPANEMLESPFDRLIAQPDRIRFNQSIQSLFSQSATVNEAAATLDINACKYTGETFPAEAALTFVASETSVFVVANIRDISERIEAQRELFESRRLYESLVASIPAHVFRKDNEGRFVYANNHFCNFIGKTGKDILGKTDYDLFPRELADKFTRDDRQVIEQRRTIHVVEENLDRDRISHMLEVMKSPVYDESGDVIGIQGLVWDVTEKYERERKIRFLSQICESSPDSIVATDVHSNITYVNDSVCKRYEYSREELIGRNVRLFKSGKYDEEFYNELYSKLQAGEEYTVEILNKTKNNHLVWEHTTFFPVYDDSGRIINFAAIHTDITERKALEEKLKASERFANSIINSMQTEIAIIGVDGFIHHANKPWLEAPVRTGMKEAAVGSNYFDMLKAKEAQGRTYARKAMNGIRSVVNGLQPRFNMQYSVRLTSEKQNWYFFNVTTMPDAYESRLIIEHQDVTAQKTLELQLMQSSKIEAIGQLAGGVAHDFNNILLVINGYASFLQNQLEPSGKAWKDAGEILKASERASNLTRQLLAFSRRQIQEITKFKINDSIQNLKKMIGRLIGENIKLTLKLDESVESIMADAGQFEQIVMNLCINARDAMPNGGEIVIETQSVVLDDAFCQTHHGIHPGRYLRFCVSDNGVGMDPDVLPRIFDPFFTTKEEGKGTGLGLSTVYGIVKQINGEIFVYSEQGKGATFKIYFPMIDDDAEIITSRKQTGFDQAKIKCSILIVEDDPAVRNFLYQILLSMGHAVHRAEDAEEAQRFLDDGMNHVDLLLTDVVMPGKSGKELAEQALESTPNLKVLFMSGYTENSIIRHGNLHEKVNFIQKPFDVAELTLKIEQILNG